MSFGDKTRHIVLTRECTSVDPVQDDPELRGAELATKKKASGHGDQMVFTTRGVVDVDMESMKVSLRCEHGALILFDFTAAFPSVSHEFRWKVLEHIGVGCLSS